MSLNGKKTILIAVDNSDTSRNIPRYLMRGSYNIITETDGKHALTWLLDHLPDMAILDFNLAGMDGLDLCRKTRQYYNGPILMLAYSDDAVDELSCLAAGADDFLIKPVKPPRLLGRIEALLRRRHQPTKDQTIIQLSDMTIDLNQRTVAADGRRFHLTTAEYEILRLLIDNRGKVLTREKIYSELKGYDYNGLDRGVDILISRLRRKLGDSGRNPRLIQSVRSVGYILTAEY